MLLKNLLYRFHFPFFVLLTLSSTTFGQDSEPLMVCEGKSIMLNSPAKGDFYQWKGPNGFESNAPSINIDNASIAMAGTYILNIKTKKVPIIPESYPQENPSQPEQYTEKNVEFIVKVKAYSEVSIVGNPTVNQGQTLKLTGISAEKLMWTSPNNEQTFDNVLSIPYASPSQSGKYRLSWISGICTFSTHITVTIIPDDTVKEADNSTSTFPTNSNTSTQFSLVAGVYGGGPKCPGATAQLYYIYSPSSDYTVSSVSWTGPNNFSSNQQEPSILNLSNSNSGNYTITANYQNRATGVTGTTTAVYPLVISLPVASAFVSNGSTKCIGSNAQLNSYLSQSANNASYSWTGPNNFTSNLQNPIVSNIVAASAGVYTVNVTFSGNCNGSSSNTLLLSTGKPNAYAYVSGNSVKCEGSNVTLNSGLSQSDLTASYSWTGPNNFTSNLQTPQIANISAINSGTYSVSIIYSGACNGTETAVAQLGIGQPSATAYINNGNVKCAGANVQLFSYLSQSDLTSTYSWSGPNGFSSTLNSPTINNISDSNIGVYTMTIAYSGVCNGTSTTTTQLSIGVPTTTVYSGNICSGSNYTLGYSFSHLDLTQNYSWTGPNNFSSNVKNPIISNFSASNVGIYTLAITYSGTCNGVATSTNKLSLNTPSINALVSTTNKASANFCSGDAITLYVNLNNLNGATTTFSWSGPDNFNSTLQNPNLSFTNAKIGTYTVTVNYTGGPCENSRNGTLTASLQIGGGANVSIYSSSTFCSGSTAQLNASLSNVSTVSYNWTGPNGYSSSGASPTISNFSQNNTGVYTVTASYTGACNGAFNGTTSTTSTLYIGSPYIIQDKSSNIFCAGATANATITLSQDNLTPTAYNWTGPNGFTSTQQNLSVPNFQAINVGTYTGSLTYTGGCSGTATSITTISLKSGQAASLLAYVQEGVTRCLGSTVNLKSALLFNVLSNATYQWQGPNGFTSNLQNPQLTNVTNANSGIYKVSANYTGTNDCGAVTSSAVSTINLILDPTILATDAVVCGSTPITFANAPRAESSSQSEMSYTYSGGTVGYDGYKKSGTDPSITISSSETIKKATITIYWEKKSGGIENSCGQVDGGGGAYYGEIKFSLKSPDGTTIMLVNSGQIYGSNNKGTLSTTFDDGGLTFLSGEPFSKTYKPQQVLSSLNNKSMNGIWTLLPEDRGTGDPLCVKAFTINFIPNRNETVTWYDAQTGGNNLATGNTYVPSNTNSGTYVYYAEATFNTSTCSGGVPARKPVNVTIVPTGSTISLKSGNWNEISTWSCGVIPTSLLRTTVQSGHIVSVPTGITGQVKTLNLLGNIDLKANASVQTNQ